MLKRIICISLSVATLFVAGCKQESPAHSGDLIVNGISNNTLYLNGNEGATTTFTISANYDWHILPTKGFVCTPDCGSAGENIEITATALQANNTINEVLLGDLSFKLKSTKFVGISTYQRPQIIIAGEYERVMLEANAGASSEIKFTATTPDFEIETTSGIEYEYISGDTDNGKYTIAITAKGDNFSNETVPAGNITFTVNNIRQQGKIDVWQRQAIRLNKSRITLSSREGSQNAFEVITPFAFEVTTTSQEFTTAISDNNTVAVIAAVANDTEAERQLGEIRICLSADTSCNTSIAVWQRAGVAQQTVMFYFLGTNLSAYFNTNINKALEALGSNIQGESRVLAFLPRSSTKATLYELHYDAETGAGVQEKIRDYTLPSRYTAEMLAENLSEMMSFAPAHSFGLIVGSHGKGWIPKSGSRTLLSRRYEDYDRIWSPVAGAPQMRHIGDAAATQINTDEFAEAVAATGKRLEYIIFDACFMSNIESIYDIRNTAQRIVASPCEVMGSGFPYEKILPLLLLDNGTRYDLDAVCHTFVDYYNTESTGIYRSACAAVIDCSQVEALAEAVLRVNKAEKKGFDTNDIQYYEGISAAYNPTHIFYDLEDFVIRSCADEDVVRAFTEQLDRTVSSRYHTETFYSAYNGKANAINHYSGITTSAPIESDSASAYIDEWRQTAWYKATH